MTIHRLSATGQRSDVQVTGSSDGTPTSLVGGRFAIDGAGNLYLVSIYSVQKLSPSGDLTTIAGGPGPLLFGNADGVGTAARFSSLHGIALDAAGNLYVADFGNYTVRKISPGGVVTTLAGSAGVAGTVDGTGPAARFTSLDAITIDDSRNLYVTDNQTIRKITPSGTVTTIVGSPGMQTFIPGPLPGAIASPLGLAVKGSDLYVTMGSGIAVVRNRP
jgi:hypothetical protein